MGEVYAIQIKVYDKDSLKCLPDQFTSFFRLNKMFGLFYFLLFQYLRF